MGRPVAGEQHHANRRHRDAILVGFDTGDVGEGVGAGRESVLRAGRGFDTRGERRQINVAGSEVSPAESDGVKRFQDGRLELDNRSRAESRLDAGKQQAAGAKHLRSDGWANAQISRRERSAAQGDRGQGGDNRCTHVDNPYSKSMRTAVVAVSVAASAVV